MILIPFAVMQKYSSQLQTRRVPRLVLHLLNFQAGFAHNLSQFISTTSGSFPVITWKPRSQLLLQKRSLLLALRLVTAGISLWATGIYRP